uniref:Uncharacterized protein n=1 Tax=Nelumbo nucifera TaxID=4432 RepID=A0A822XN20_NELNU|nr:TPA_asm: hypothetical protein HUJ06_022905 [Nelumbo nucifera]
MHISPLAMTILLLSLFCFSALLSPLRALTLPSDTSALKAFKNAIKPATISPWSCLASWNFSIDPCSLPRRSYFICGITCNSDNTRVTALVLDPAGYSGTLSPQLSNGPIPSSLSSLTKLQTLSLSSNSFSGPFPPSLTRLTSLNSLDISHNALARTLPQTMSSLSNVRTIDLSFNKLTGSLPKLPPNLVELAIRANFLSGSLLQSSFQGSSQLEVVELGANMFSGVLNSWFFLLPSLQQVDLSNNSFTRLEIWKPSNKDSNLVAVDLGFNSLEGYLPVNFASFPLLSSLSLRHNRFRGPIPLEYGKKLSLRRLFLDGNFLNGKVPDRFFSGAGGSTLSGSFGDNCLESCPNSSQLCLPLQKSPSMCRQAYGGKPRSVSSWF